MPNPQTSPCGETTLIPLSAPPFREPAPTEAVAPAAGDRVPPSPTRSGHAAPTALTPPAAAGRSRGSARGARLRDLFDALLAAAVLTALAPLLLLIALLIKLDSPGPVLYRQARYGRDQRVFTLLKFRTLYADVCDDPAGAFRQVTRDDPRVTRIGRFLRRSSLDELPQLINVLRGEMAIVGPRPHPLALAAEFGPKVEGYALRHRVKPGITGWAQINGLRGETPTVEAMARRVRFDIDYIQRRSVLFDLKIVLLTPLFLLREIDAY